MDAEGLKELFEPFAAVSVKRMFSGYGVYADGLCFALNLRGDIFLKADALTEARFKAAGSEPFVYDGHRGRVTVMSYWRLTPTAYDDPDELKQWCALAFEAARRAFDLKAARKAKAAKSVKRSKREKPAKAASRSKAAPAKRKTASRKPARRGRGGAR
ncbi:MAG TPA: TfoX/Sxy family protein [Roseiarcus sp.]|nr:TfoX/Sxy family protein [Roseiarcus sp.]